MQVLLGFLVLENTPRLSDADWEEEEEEATSISTKQLIHSKNYCPGSYWV